jgi:hypothetical protein
MAHDFVIRWQDHRTTPWPCPACGSRSLVVGITPSAVYWNHLFVLLLLTWGIGLLIIPLWYRRGVTIAGCSCGCNFHPPTQAPFSQHRPDVHRHSGGS